MEFDQFHRNAQGLVEPKFKVLFRIEIPRSQFTYKNAVDKIIQLNDEYDFDWIAVDRGYGETQIELLHDYGLKNPTTRLAEKVVGYQFSQKLDVRDPHTRKKDKKHLKPFMVNNSVNVFEKGKIILNPDDDILTEQLSAYVVKSVSSTGMPTYTSDNEHAVDALNLCLLIFEQKYGNLMRHVISTKVIGFDQKDIYEGVTPERVASLEEPKKANNVVKLGTKQDVFIKDLSFGAKKSRFRESTTRRMF